MNDYNDIDMRFPDNRYWNVIDLTSSSRVRSRDSSTSSDYMDSDSDSFERNSRPRKRRKLTTIVIDSQDDSDPSEETAEEGKNKKDSSTTPVRKDETTDLCSCDVDSEKCPICLEPMEKQELGSPEHCDHMFCDLMLASLPIVNNWVSFNASMNLPLVTGGSALVTGSAVVGAIAGCILSLPLHKNDIRFERVTNLTISSKKSFRPGAP